MADCFWTDLLGVSQDCGGDEPAPDFTFFDIGGGGAFSAVVPFDARYVLGLNSVRQVSVFDSQNPTGAVSQTEPAGTLDFSSITDGQQGLAVLAGQAVWAGLDASASPVMSIVAMNFALPDILGVFAPYEGPLVNISAATGFVAGDNFLGLVSDGSAMYFARVGGTDGVLYIYKHEAGQDLETGWILHATAAKPTGGAFSDITIGYDAQLPGATVSATNGRPGSLSAYTVYRITSGGIEVAVTATVEDNDSNISLRYWAAKGKFVGKNLSTNSLITVDTSGEILSLVENVADAYPYGDYVLYGTRTACDGNPLFCMLLAVDGSSTPTAAEMTYTALNVWLTLPDMKAAWGRLPNVCL